LPLAMAVTESFAERSLRVSPSLPRSTIAGGVGAETMVSSFGQATRSSRRSTTINFAGITLSVSQRE
jgi:hypothetical protein